MVSRGGWMKAGEASSVWGMNKSFEKFSLQGIWWRKWKRGSELPLLSFLGFWTDGCCRERADQWWSFLSIVSWLRSVLEVEMTFAIGPGAKPFDFTGIAGMLFLNVMQDFCHTARCAGWLPNHWILLRTGSYRANFNVHKWKLYNSIVCLTGYQWNEIPTNGISKSDPDYSHMSFRL